MRNGVVFGSYEKLGNLYLPHRLHFPQEGECRGRHKLILENFPRPLPNMLDFDYNPGSHLRRWMTVIGKGCSLHRPTEEVISNV